MDKTSGYKIGDRVVGIKDPQNSCKKIRIKNIEGTVVHFYDEEAPHIGVEFDAYIGGHPCLGHSKEGFGWYVFPDEIQRIEKPNTERKSLYDLVIEKWPHNVNERDFDSIENDVSYHLLLGFTLDECIDAALLFYEKNQSYDDDPVACFNFGMSEYLEY